jgi:hypothetical protein
MMGVPIALLQDNFTPATSSPAWAGSRLTGSATLAQTGGQAVINLPSSVAGAHAAYWLTSGVYDLTGDAFYWNIGTMVSTAVAASAFFQLATRDFSNQLFWRQLSNAITVRTVIAGVETQRFTATWSASTYKYLRIRESGGTVFWDSSTNGTSWTNRFSMANPFAVTDLAVQFAASCGNVASPGSLKLDDVNLILPTPSATWRETTADWQIENRFRPITLASDGGKQGVLVTADSMDSSRVLGGTIHYYGGPLGSVSGGYLALTEYASLALAQASPFTIPVNGRVDLPAFVDARYMRLYHRSVDASAHTIYEFVPRRIVQADDIEAESINAIHIVAHSITADQISTINLDATAQITAGGGVVRMNDLGISIEINQTGTFSTPEAISWYDSTMTTVETYIWCEEEPGAQTMNIVAHHNAAATKYGNIVIVAEGGTADASIVLTGANSGAASISIGATTSMAGGLNMGSATGAGTGEISTSGNIAAGAAIGSGIRILTKGASTTSSDYALVCQNSTPGNLFYVRDDGTLFVAPSGGAIGFMGATAVTRPAVTGSRAANVALASLCTALANLGLITNSTTV